MSTFTIKSTFSTSELFNQFNAYDSCKNAFSYDAFERILEHEEEMANSCGEEAIDFDPIAINCTYTEASAEEILETYSNLFDREDFIDEDDEDAEIDEDALIDALNDYTSVIGRIHSEDTIVFTSF